MQLFERPNHTELKTILSFLWIFILFNILFKDIHELFRPGFLDQMLTGTVNGVLVSESTMFVAAIGLQLPISMIVLSRVLAYPANRLLNMVMPVLTAVIIIANEPNPDPDNIFFATVEIITLAIIAWLAWQWPAPQKESK